MQSVPVSHTDQVLHGMHGEEQGEVPTARTSDVVGRLWYWMDVGLLSVYGHKRYVCMYVRMYSMYVCMYVCMYVHMYVRMYVLNICMAVCMYICMNVRMYVRIYSMYILYVRTYACMHMYVYTYVYTCMYLLMYKHVCTCTYIQRLRSIECLCMHVCIIYKHKSINMCTSDLMPFEDSGYIELRCRL